jgi:lipid II:glycine glycyltransferase (peptidoglycan interpeptide bridge formation enzyme)
MTEIIVKKVEKRDEWEDFLTKHLEASFLQSWEWGEFHAAMGDRIWRFGFYENESLVGVMLMAEEDAKRGRYLVVPGGPIIDWSDRKIVKKAFETMKKTAKEVGAAMVRVRPQLEDTAENRELFAQNGLKIAPMHLHAELTHRLNLAKDPDEMLKDMRQGTRYDIKRADKLGIKVDVVAGGKKLDNSTKKALKKFYDLQIETAQRQGFVPFGEKFLMEQFRVFNEVGNVLLYDATKDGETLAMAFVIFYHNEAVYHYGVSSDAGRKLPGAAAAQWTAILEAKKRGMGMYNFWGVSPENEVNHRFTGLSRFKRGFGGQDFAYLHAHDLVTNRVKYAVLWAIETARRHHRHV